MARCPIRCVSITLFYWPQVHKVCTVHTVHTVAEKCFSRKKKEHRNGPSTETWLSLSSCSTIDSEISDILFVDVLFVMYYL